MKIFVRNKRSDRQEASVINMPASIQSLWSSSSFSIDWRNSRVPLSPTSTASRMLLLAEVPNMHEDDHTAEETTVRTR
jgi:hypothetical protein